MVCGMEFLFYMIEFCLLAASACSEEPSVTIPSLGTISGLATELTFDGRTHNVREYLGIPYAETPVRFQKPERKSPFSAPYRAVQYGPACSQAQFGLPISETSDDCLFLNVFVPGDSSPTPGLPVMIWFHGGGYIMGSADPYHSSTLAGFGEVIVVTVNYRLGVQGFLCTGDDQLPGNYGLWDQHLAIRWVHDYISFFGGDPGRVTLFGQSGGAFSVNFQSMFAGNKGLVHGVISESGNPTMREAYTEIPEAIASTKLIAGSLGCSGTDSQAIKECFMAASAEEINSALMNLFYNPATVLDVKLTPCFDNDFVKVDPKRFASSAAKDGTPEEDVFSSINFMNGANNDEGAYYLAIYYGIADVENFTIAKDEMFGFVNRSLEIQYPDGYPPELVNQVQALYTDWQRPDDPVRLRDLFVKLNSDFKFIIPALEMTKKHAFLNGPGETYFYFFTGPVQGHAVPSPSWIQGAVHGDELPYVFGFQPALLTYINMQPPTDWQLQMAKAVMTFWTNFAKSGNPNQPVDVQAYLNNAPWPAYDLEKKGFAELMSPVSEVKQWFYAQEDNFWTALVPQILRSQSKTCPPVEPLQQGYSLAILIILLTFPYLYFICKKAAYLWS